MTALLVMGSARGVWDDVAAFGDAAFVGDRLVVNDAGLYYRRPIQHWASRHPEDFKYYRAIREKVHRNLMIRESFTVHSQRIEEGVDRAWPDIRPRAGTSGLFGILVGLALDYEPVICAGLPLDGSGHFYSDPHQKVDSDYSDAGDPFLYGTWERVAEEQGLYGRVFSMSGRTRALFGAPPEVGI